MIVLSVALVLAERGREGERVAGREALGAGFEEELCCGCGRCRDGDASLETARPDALLEREREREREEEERERNS